jgi:predicted PurR-regulated permease PerM
MTVLLALVILLPITVLGLSLGDSVRPVAEAIRDWWARGLPPPPQWLGELPLIGPRVHAYWLELTQDSAKLGSEIQRLLEPLRHWLLSGGLQIGAGLLYLMLSVVLAFFLPRQRRPHSPTAVLQRIAGSRAARLTAVAGGTIRSVVYGILGTAFAQAILAAIGLWIAGVPGALLWGMLTFFLSVVPVGPPLVWGSAVLWLVSQGSIGWAIFMAVWCFFVISGIDNIIKPYLISRGSRLPFILTLLGVLGGALAFGFIGVFLGCRPGLPPPAGVGGHRTRARLAPTVVSPRHGAPRSESVAGAYPAE